MQGPIQASQKRYFRTVICRIQYGKLGNSSFFFGDVSLYFEVRVGERQGSNGGALNRQFRKLLYRLEEQIVSA